MDRLNSMYSKQERFQEQIYGGAFPRVDFHMVEKTIISIVGELGEILENYQGWKPHRKNPPEPDFENLKEEAIDVLHYAINLCIGFGMTVDEVFDRFMYKNKINQKRQEEGY